MAPPLLAPIIGGLGTVLGPLLGSFFIHGVGELTKATIGQALGNRPGVDLILFGVLQILVLAILPRGLVGLWATIWRKMTGGGNA